MRTIAIVVGVVVLAIVGLLAFAALLVSEEKDAAFAAFEATTLEAHSIPQTMPFRLVAGHIVVEAVVGDADQVVPVILDTGAPVTLSDALAEQYGSEAVGQISIAAIDGSVLKVDVVSVRSVRIGGAVFTDVGAVKGFVHLDNPLSCISPHGLIGASLMRTGVWQIDYGKGEVTIAPSIEGLDHIDGAARIEFTGASPSSPSPVITIPAGDGTLTFLVDTGSGGWLTLNPADAESVGAALGADAPSLTIAAAGAAGTFRTELAYATSDLEFDDLALESVPLAILEFLTEGQGNIGNQFLSHFIVTIDWPGNTLYLEPTAEIITPKLPASAGITWDGERILVGSLVHGSDAEAAGVLVGAPVTAIDGVDVSAATRDEFCALLVGMGAEDSFEMTLGGEQPLTVAIAPVADFYEPLEG